MKKPIPKNQNYIYRHFNTFHLQIAQWFNLSYALKISRADRYTVLLYSLKYSKTERTTCTDLSHPPPVEKPNCSSWNLTHVFSLLRTQYSKILPTVFTVVTGGNSSNSLHTSFFLALVLFYRYKNFSEQNHDYNMHQKETVVQV